MDNILIQKVSRHGMSSELYDGPSLQELIRDTDIYLNKLRDAVRLSKLDNTAIMPYCPYLKERLDKYTMCHVYGGPYDSYISDISLLSLNELILHNNDIATTFSNGIDVNSIDIAHGKHIYIAKDKGEIDGFLSKYTFMRPNVCHKCSCSIVEDDVEEHSKSTTCHNKELDNILKARNLVQISNDDEDQIIRTKNILYEYHPSEYLIFIPKWVEQAIKMYDSMRSRGGFQDIPLSKYLDQMAESETSK